MYHFNKNSIAVKLTLIMFGIVVLQGVLLIGGILLSGVLPNLRSNDYNSFSKTAAINSKYVEDKMNLGLGNILSYAYEVVRLQKELPQINESVTFKDNKLMMDEIMPIVLDMLNFSFTTGAFVILDNDLGTNQYSTMYLKDSEPFTYDQTNGDISIFRGPKEAAGKANISEHELWEFNLELTEDFYEVYTEPMRVAKDNSDMSQLGYWQFSQGLVNDNYKVATFSMPLIDKNGEAFGVIGIEVIEDSFYDILPDVKMSGEGGHGHIFATADKDLQYLEPILTQRSVNSSFAKYGTPLELETIDESLNMFRIKSLDYPQPIVGSIIELELYEETSPFYDTKWMIIGLIEEAELLSFTNTFINSLTLTFLATIFLVTIMVFLAGKKFAMPISTLVKKIRTNDIETVISLGKTGYWEIDELSSSIEELKQRSLNLGLKTNKILHMVNLPIGTFEYQKDSDYVICSSAFIQLFDFSKSEKLSVKINQKEFFEKMNAMKENIENANENIYRINKTDEKWVKLVTIEDADSMLGVGVDMTKEVLENKALIRERDYDGLTKLLNRFGFRRKVDEIFVNGVKQEAALILFDLDNLKYVNDTYGHDMGDLYIQTAAKEMEFILGQHGTISRMAGDEFYVFFNDFSTKDAIRNMLKKLYARFEESRLTLSNGDLFKIRLSGGIAWYGDDSQDLDELIRFADFAMYQGKHSIKGMIREFSKDSFENESFLLSGREELNRVLDNQLIDYAFQTIISNTGEIYGYEALLRPQSELLNSPMKLIQIATEQSQLWKIEQITFFKLLAHYKQYREMFQDCKLFINTIPNEILSDEEYAQIELWYPDILKFLVLEFTENEKITEEALKKKCDKIDEWGGLVALDDYGTGYNGEIALLSLKPNIIKIDKAIISHIETDTNRQLIVNKLLVYAKEKGMLVLGEGVETYSQMEYLVHAGLDLLQGFYIARPQFQPNFDNTNIKKELEEIRLSKQKND